jgi:hypothetical protein
MTNKGCSKTDHRNWLPDNAPDNQMGNVSQANITIAMMAELAIAEHPTRINSKTAKPAISSSVPSTIMQFIH